MTAIRRHDRGRDASLSLSMNIDNRDDRDVEFDDNSSDGDNDLKRKMVIRLMMIVMMTDEAHDDLIIGILGA